MKNTIGRWLAGTLLCAATAFAQDDARRAAAEEMMTTANMQQVMETMFAALKQTLPAQMRQMAKPMMGGNELPERELAAMDGLLDIVAEEFGWEKVKEDFIALYAGTFTEEELKSITAFYKSPAGKALLQKQPEVMKRSMELNQKLMGRIMPRIQALMAERLKAVQAPPIQK